MILKVVNLCKKYAHIDGVVDALQNVSFDVKRGDFVTITGSSGSGKTTLLLTLAGLINSTSGVILFKDFRIDKATDGQLSGYRKNNVGFVMQSFALIPYLTALENVMLPLAIFNMPKSQKHDSALELLRLVGLDNRKNHLPKELSAGQQQRVAIARALVNNPSLILADEPTGNLDPSLSTDILNLLKRINEEKNVTMLMVTHSPLAAGYGNNKIHLVNGSLINN
jgi:putative ABC transport system ATP-binding protein